MISGQNLNFISLKLLSLAVASTSVQSQSGLFFPSGPTSRTSLWSSVQLQEVIAHPFVVFEPTVCEGVDCRGIVGFNGDWRPRHRAV